MNKQELKQAAKKGIEELMATGMDYNTAASSMQTAAAIMKADQSEMMIEALHELKMAHYERGLQLKEIATANDMDQETIDQTYQEAGNAINGKFWELIGIERFIRATANEHGLSFETTRQAYQEAGDQANFEFYDQLDEIKRTINEAMQEATEHPETYHGKK